MPVHVTPTVTDPRDLIDSEAFGRLVDGLARENLLSSALADRVMVQTLGFLFACANNEGAKLAPSRTVDMGWHMFILHTREYIEFCDRVAGRYVHHVPESGALEVHAPAVATTLAAMRDLGLPVDDELWPVVGDCSQCHAGCTDSP
ncbi:glycine-rich domain-containing protein [Spirillospora sp. NPDC048911]|uniref:glycine-rich domain-containing protein n=1 Tax=Spirillospora sp. NPDC048911 TaxID=3364527 RepID=UPI003714E3D0